MSLATGTWLGPYQIISDLGKGGMGEVYRAMDTRLERQVAIKVLSEHLAGNKKALERFEREAKTLAALSHPNIVAIYDIGTDRGVSFVAMELLEGETLRDYMDRAPLSWRRALEIASVIANALAAAHSKGVTHRDLKPENIFLTATGIVKILDFGLARLDRIATSEELRLAPTGGIGTESGIIMGTVQYMSPEQARGQIVDNRTDIWAFGCVLYEMLTRRRAFQEHTVSDTIASLLLKEPRWEELPQDLPPRIRKLLRQCLQKDAGSRPQDVTVVKIEIDKALVDTITVTKPHLKTRPARKRIKSLAVLPLANLSRDSEKEYFADGMTEALISGLAKLGGLRIISRTSAMCYKGSTKSLPEIARELNVDAVIEGSVMLVGQRVRITVQLISAATDMHLWAEEYDRDLQDVLLLQSEVAQTVAKKIQVALTPDDTRRLLGDARPVNPEAYEACLKGRYHLYRVTPEHLVSALGYFQLALEKDPKYAAAYAGIGEIWLQRCMRGYLSAGQALSKAKEALLRALELDESAGEVHESLALYKFFEWDWDGVEKECQRAIQLNGNSAYAHLIYSDFLIHVGRNQEASEEMTRALELDPLNSFLQTLWGWQLVFLRRSDDAIEQLQKTLAAEPNFSTAHLGLWGAFYQKRMHQEALEQAKKFFTVIGDSEIVEALTCGYAEGGYSQAMSRAAQKLTERSNQVHVPAIRIARLYAHAGLKDQTLHWLEKAYEQRELPLIHLKIGWDWDCVRDDPRYQRLLRQMNFLP